jgi:hypothetical protein
MFQFNDNGAFGANNQLTLFNDGGSSRGIKIRKTISWIFDDLVEHWQTGVNYPVAPDDNDDLILAYIPGLGDCVRCSRQLVSGNIRFKVLFGNSIGSPKDQTALMRIDNQLLSGPAALQIQGSPLAIQLIESAIELTGTGTSRSIYWAGGADKIAFDSSHEFQLTRNNSLALKIGAGYFGIENRVLQGLSAPSAGTDATNKTYVDARTLAQILAVSPSAGSISITNFVGGSHSTGSITFNSSAGGFTVLTGPIDLNGTAVGFFGATPIIRQAAGATVAETAGGSYTANEQTMLANLKATLNTIRASLVANGLLV